MRYTKFQRATRFVAVSQPEMSCVVITEEDVILFFSFVKVFTFVEKEKKEGKQSIYVDAGINTHL